MNDADFGVDAGGGSGAEVQGNYGGGIGCLSARNDGCDDAGRAARG